ncbi:Hypothetical protein R9X50_00734900 [Acrodontium crateriforme]|uniref:N-terminal nucleophile aminohydrolase n=1 Tax=Acrodontium crateriforme TaxID=150365 RepID=A0AAQ3MBP6_9PEZI|nr:Hypothetical protein R9X50_00734900 [Acrodontium crateriforme]
MFGSRRHRSGGDVACIFVHAGAGYHSVQNENVHLAACNDAAKSAMAVLKAGGTAVDAVEIAIKVLEDREITNAGYGSNLAVDGVVECDAVVVDHLGRSGGAGAVAQVKNPISLARLILDHATQTLSLRRVPPNFLAGQGATDFAYEHDMPIVPHGTLISEAAGQRWRRWRVDLRKAELSRKREEAERYGLSPPPSDLSSCDLPSLAREEGETSRQQHMEAMMTSTWNEAQPISPPPSDMQILRAESSSPSHMSSGSSVMRTRQTPDSQTPLESTDPYGPPGMLEDASKTTFANTHKSIHSKSLEDFRHRPGVDGGMYLQNQRASNMSLSDLSEADQGPISTFARHSHSPNDHGVSSGPDYDETVNQVNNNTHGQQRTYQHQRSAVDGAKNMPLPDSSMFPLAPQNGTAPIEARILPPLPADAFCFDSSTHQQDDMITDTVGAIAIDVFGNIACGASSGGIGMKHRGRIGPAALVGIGAAVQPVDEEDTERTTVATVTSGTGEHMATTTAAGVCTERVYHNIRKRPGGFYEECGDDEAIKGFIERDFMGHPSVKNSTSSGAIGMLTVKKTTDGVYLYFGHNTDSFALASMHSDESKPVCTMSRNKGNASIAQGGRAIRFRRKVF